MGIPICHRAGMKQTILTLSTLLLAPLAVVGASDWPNWRGPAANGSAPTGTYPTRWTAEDVAWKTALPGKGSSTPVVWQSRIYLTTPADGQDAVLALAADGKQQWLVKLGPESTPRHKTLASSCNSSPVTDGKGIFASFRSGRLVALELNGTVRWQMNIIERFGPENLIWDQASSPVVTGQHVIFTRMHHGDSWVAGFDKATGELRWQQKRNYEVPSENDNAYTTPVLFDYKGKPAFLIWGADHLTAHAAADGTLLWSCGGFNPREAANWPAIATPVVQGGIAVVPVGRDDRQGQARVHGIRIDGSGDVTATHRAWQRDDLGVFCCSPAEYEGRVYLLRHRGGVVCLDPATGKTIWADALPRSTATYYASPAIANGILYAAREDGVVFTARVTDRFELLSENPLGERVVASPVLANNSLLIRGDKHLFSIAAKSP
jgi:outer membrane protein assembly factor BamB